MHAISADHTALVTGAFLGGCIFLCSGAGLRSSHVLTHVICSHGEGGTVVLPVLQMGKLRPRGQWLGQVTQQGFHHAVERVWDRKRRARFPAHLHC